MVRTKGVSRQVWAIQKRDGSIDLAARRREGIRGRTEGPHAERVFSCMALTDMGNRLRHASGYTFGPLWLTKREAQQHAASWEMVVPVRVIAPDPPRRTKEVKA